jgi:hypothetical protein
MTGLDLNAASAPLLGTVGWYRADWAVAYYPPDLPADWCLAFIANACDCVLLRPDAWCAAGAESDPRLAAAVDEAPDTLVFFLQVPPDTVPSPAALAKFVGRPVALLVDRPLTLPGEWPQWHADGDGAWVAPEGPRVLTWWVDEVDLRAWRDRASQLDPGLYALLLDGPAASPAQVLELRTLLQLMGIA